MPNLYSPFTPGDRVRTVYPPRFVMTVIDSDYSREDHAFLVQCLAPDGTRRTVYGHELKRNPASPEEFQFHPLAVEYRRLLREYWAYVPPTLNPSP